MPRVIFVNRFYWPEEPATSQLLTDLAEAVAAAGFKVTVITSHGRTAAARRESHRGVEILRVGPARHDGRSLGFRLIDFVGFMLAALWQLVRTVRGGDVVVCMSDPPLIGTLAQPLLDWRDARLIHWIQDIYPEVAIALTGHRWLRILQPCRDHAWRRADRCVTLGPDMATVLNKAGVRSERVAIIPNWAPEGLSEAPAAESDAIKSEWGVAGKFVVLYSGNLGQVHDLMPVLDIAAELKHEMDIAFVFVGSGAQQAELRRSAQQRQLGNVSFQAHQPRSRLGATLSAGDLHWVTLKAGCEACVLPSKLHGIMAVGRPVWFIGPAHSELFHRIENEEIGRSFTRTQVKEAAAAILALKHDPKRSAAMAAAARRVHQRTGFATSRSAWLNLLGRHPPSPQH